MKRTLRREKGDRFCDLEISLENGRLSICGSEGRIVTERAGRKEAFEYWRSFFEENRDELARMALDHGKRTAASAARFVLQSDGEFHGLDVHRAASDKLYVTESCGQIREALAEWFPEHVWAFEYHLNDMHAGTERQEVELAKHAFDAEASAKYHGSHYDWACAILNEAGLLVDNGYRYGSEWLKRDLPREVIAWAERSAA